MSAANGQPIIKIGKKGRRLFQFGSDEDPTVVQVDVVACHNEWSEIDRQFRDAENKVPGDKVAELNRVAWDFVRQIVAKGSPAVTTEEKERIVQIVFDISLADALDFLARVTEEGLALRHFFEVKSPDEPSSRASTELRFST